MNKRQKEVIQAQLTEEQKVIKQLEQHYRLALDDVEMVIRLLQSDEQTPSKIRRVAYQQKLKTQLEAILERMRLGEYKTLQEYLTGCYTSGYVGTMYDIHGQGVPVIAPINQDAAAKAIQLDTQLSTRKVHKSANGEMMALYESLGIDTDSLKKTIRSEITRGIANGSTYDIIARNIANVSKAPLARAKTIARTEGHRIMQQSAEDARLEAQKHGADVVRQWDATLDGDTRSAHRELDGQIVEMDEYFHYGTKKAKYPGGFGDPALDCNCRCVALTRARRSLDEKEMDTLKKRAEAFGLDKTESFKDFEKKYLKAAKQEADVSFWDLNGTEKPKVEYSIALSNRFEEGTSIAKSVYTKYIPRGGAVDDGKFTGNPYHFNGNIYMDYEQDAVNKRGAGTTFFHEHGHYVDEKAGYLSHSKEFLKAMKNDLQDLYASTGMGNKRDAEFAITVSLCQKDIRNKANGISDIVYGLTKGKAGGAWYHKERGYYNGYALQQEAFAHMFEASFSAEKQALMKKYFPRSWQLFNEMMEGAL